MAPYGVRPYPKLFGLVILCGNSYSEYSSLPTNPSAFSHTPQHKGATQMENATLMSHVDTDVVTREQLGLIETPDATRSFKPVPHIELISTLEDVLRENQIAIR